MFFSNNCFLFFYYSFCYEYFSIFALQKFSYKLKYIYIICLLFSLVFCTELLFAQNVRQIDNVVIDYMQFADNQSVLYYGNLQEGHPRASNHPYLKEMQYAKARLSYRNIIYPEVMLRLDLNRNELVILSPNNHNIVLFSENVDFAELHDQHIIFFRRDSLSGSPSTGYYTVLYSENCKVLKKQTATMTVKNTGSTTQEQYYVFRNYFYLYKDDTYHTIRNKRGLLKALNPHKKELKQFISTNKLSFRRNADYLLVRTVSEYEKLSGSL